MHLNKKIDKIKKFWMVEKEKELWAAIQWLGLYRYVVPVGCSNGIAHGSVA